MEDPILRVSADSPRENAAFSWISRYGMSGLVLPYRWLRKPDEPAPVLPRPALEDHRSR
jgi:hypothetical protein